MRPVAEPHLPTVNVKELQARPVLFGNIDQRPTDIVELGLQPPRVDRIVAEPSLVASAGVVVALAGSRHAVAYDCPITMRHIPGQHAIMKHCCKIDDLLRIDGF